MEISIKERKAAARKAAKEKINALPAEYKEAADAEIAKKIISLPEYKSAETVFCFVSMPGEINTRPVIINALDAGKTVCVPKCSDKPGIMHCFEIKSYDDLEAGKFGIREPKKGCRLVPPDEIDFAVVPCCAAGRSGQRLGFGGGYYDRYLEHADFPRALICRERIMLDEVPEDEHDLRFGIVISEEKIYRL